MDAPTLQLSEQIERAMREYAEAHANLHLTLSNDFHDMAMHVASVIQPSRLPLTRNDMKAAYLFGGEEALKEQPITDEERSNLFDNWFYDNYERQ